MNQSQIDNYNASESGKAWRNHVIEYPSFNRLFLLAAAENQDGPLTSLTGGLFMLGQIGEERLYLALSGAGNELFASRLARAIDCIRVPGVWLATSEDVNTNMQHFLRLCCDDLQGKRYSLTPWHFVKAIPGGWVVSELVRNALPVSFLTDKVLTSPRQFSSMWDVTNKPSPLPREAFDDFPRQFETDEKVLAAAKWDSEQRLASYAFRAWLGCGFPHGGNTLITTGGDVWTVDHNNILHYPNCEDIKDLANLVAQSERVLGICRRMSAITEQHIEDALDDIPAKFWEVEGVLNNRRRAADYFCERAAAWRRCFNVEAGQAA